MTGLIGSATEEKPENTKWLTQVNWNWVNVLETLDDTSDGFVGEFCSNFDRSKAVFDTCQPQKVEWPNNFELKCTPLLRACLFFVIRTDAAV